MNQRIAGENGSRRSHTLTRRIAVALTAAAAVCLLGAGIAVAEEPATEADTTHCCVSQAAAFAGDGGEETTDTVVDDSGNVHDWG